MRWISTTTVVISICLLLWIGGWQRAFSNINTDESRLGSSLLLLIACSESLGGLPWDLLLIKGRTKLVALKQGLFAPVKLAAAVIGSYILGIEGALLGYAIASIGQVLWVKEKISPYLLKPGEKRNDWSKTWQLIKTGLPLYATNSIAAIVFLPLLAGVASAEGISDVGYLRIGQLVVQLFACSWCDCPDTFPAAKRRK